MYHSRMYQDQADLEQMTALLVDVRPQLWITDYPSPSDLYEIFQSVDIQKNTKLWHDTDGKLQAWAFVSNYGNLRFEIRSGIELGAELMKFGIETSKQLNLSHLATNCRMDDENRVQLLEKHGFQMQSTRSVFLSRSMDNLLNNVELPEGFKIRNFQEQDLENLVALHQAAFGTNHMTISERLAIMSNPEYDSQLDLVIVAPDGDIVAYSVSTINHQENRLIGKLYGWIDTVATHPNYRRMGLAQFLVQNSILLLKEAGISHAMLGTMSTNLGMLRVATSLGFTSDYEKAWFEILHEDR